MSVRTNNFVDISGRSSAFRSLMYNLSGGWMNMPADWSDIRKDCPDNSIALYAGHTENYKFETQQGDITYETVGNPTIVDGVISNFSDNDYATFSQPFRPGSKPWKVKVDFRTTDDWGAYRGILSKEGGYCFVIAFTAGQKLEVALSSNGTSLDIGFFNTTYALEDYTEYSVVVEFTGSSYIALIRKAGENYKPIGTGIIQSSTPIFDNDEPLNIGQGRLLDNNFRGSINLNNTYIEIDNQMWYGLETRMVAANPDIYLESSGTQYIDTSVIADNETGILIKASVCSNNNTDNIFVGSRRDSGNTRFSLDFDWSSAGNMTVGYNGYHTTSFSSLGLSSGQECVSTLNFRNDRTAKVNDILCKNLEDITLIQQTSSIYLFRLNYSSPYPYTGKIYNVQISQGNTIIKNLVPVPAGLVIGSFTCPSNGMFDIVNQDFYSNAGTGNFTYGGANASAYDNLGFTATCIGGYNVFIDGVQYGSTYASQSQCNITWSEYTATAGESITTPQALTAHKIWIEPATEGNDITAFHCARVAASGTEQQGVLWAHFNISNAINLSKGFSYADEYHNELLMASTAKNNLIIATGLDYCFYSALSLEYLPKIDYSNVSDMTNFITEASNLNKTNIDTSKNNTIVKIGAYGSSQYFMNGFKGLRVSNEAPFDSATAPQINVSYTGMDRDALVQLFNDLPYNVGYEVVGSPTINNGVVSGFSVNDYLKLNNTSNSTSWEIYTEFIFDYYNGYQGLFSIASPHFQVFISSSATYSLSLEHRYNAVEVISNQQMTSGHKYSLSIKHNNGHYQTRLYNMTRQELNSEKEFDGTSVSLSGLLRFGITQSGNYYWHGSQDIANTYIKVNDVTWFNGKAAMTKTLSCVGCTGNQDKLTIVGSPTISDGVVSGFSSSKYIKTSSNLPISSDEIFTTFTTGSDVSTSQVMFSCGSAFDNRTLACTIESGGYFGYGYSKNGTAWADGYNITNYLMSANTEYNISYSFSPSAVIVKIKKSTETSWTEFTNQLTQSLYNSNTYLKFGVDLDLNKPFLGSIDLNNTYIKVNGELFFGREQYLLPEDKAIATDKGWSLTLA